MQVVDLSKKQELEKFDVKVSEELIVAISQYKSIDYTKSAIEALKKEGVKFTTLILFDGSSDEDYEKIQNLADISIRIKKRINSLPQIWNIMFGAAKLTAAKYLYWQGSDMLLNEHGLENMLMTMKLGYDAVSPIKIDNDVERFKNYKRVYNRVMRCAGINDSACLFRLDKLDFFCFDEMYAPYQFETSALGYALFRKKCRMCIDDNAVILHYCSKDIEHSPKEREIGSKTWDMKRDYFLKDASEDKRWFFEKSIMNSEIVKDIGFPAHIYLGDPK
jgi:hypothetical protein